VTESPFLLGKPAARREQHKAAANMEPDKKFWAFFLQNQAQVAHACNPRNSGGRDQEDYGLKPDGANSLQDRISKKPTIFIKKGWCSGSRYRGPVLQTKQNKTKKHTAQGLVMWLKQ
jgi:hypothetical protein